MTQASNPLVKMSIIGATTATVNDSRRIEIVGCKNAAGTATAGELYQNVLANQVDIYFGNNSEIADAFYAVRNEINDITPIDVIPMTELVSGTADIKTATFDGTATGAGTITMGVSNARYGEKTISVPKLTSGVATDADDVAVLVAAAYASVTKLVSTVAVDASVTDQVNVTYNHKGAQGAGNVLWCVCDVPGITVALAHSATGAGAPDMTAAFDVNGQTRYTGIAQPGEWSYSEATDFMDDRFNVDNKILDGTVFVCKNATSSAAISEASALNSQCLSLQVENTEAKSWWIGSSMFEGNLARAAQVAALKALRLTTGADISDFVSGSTGIDDTIGGVELASLPYMNTPMPWPVMGAGFGYAADVLESMKDAGCWFAGNNDAGTGVVLDELVTTYKTDDNGDDDDSFKYQCYVDTITEIRSYNMTNIKSQCRQSRGTSGSIKPRRNINNEQTIRGKFIDYFGDTGDMLLTRDGEEADQFFSDNLSVSYDDQTGVFTCSMKSPIITQLREINAPIQIAFSL